MAQSLVAHMPGTFVDLLIMMSDNMVPSRQPVQLGGPDKDQVADEAIAGASMWLRAIVSACPTKVPGQHLIADAFLVANACMNGRLFRVPSNLYGWAAPQSPRMERASKKLTSTMAAQAGVNSKRMISHIWHLWRNHYGSSNIDVQGPIGNAPSVINEINALMRPPLVAHRRIMTPVRIGYTDLARHGFTPHCPKCDRIQAGERSPGTIHDATCRTRILKLLAKDERGLCRTAQAEFRAQWSIAEHIEKMADESMIDESALVAVATACGAGCQCSCCAGNAMRGASVRESDGLRSPPHSSGLRSPLTESEPCGEPPPEQALVLREPLAMKGGQVRAGNGSTALVIKKATKWMLAERPIPRKAANAQKRMLAMKGGQVRAGNGPTALLSRRMYITKKVFEIFGYTSGCPRCEHEIYLLGRTTRRHSERCRARIMAEYAKTYYGRQNLIQNVWSQERTVAEHLQQHDSRRPA